MEEKIISNPGTAVLMRHLQHNHPNQIFGSASSDDISLPANAEWQLSQACTENEEHIGGRRETSILPQSVPVELNPRLRSHLICSETFQSHQPEGTVVGNRKRLFK